MDKNPKTFKDWLVEKYLGRDTPEGDLAGDVDRDRDFPKLNSRVAILHHLQRLHACEGAFRTFERCWKRYTEEAAFADERAK